MDGGFGGKIMVSVYNEQLVVVAGDGTHDRGNVIVLSFKGDACHARLIKEIEVFVRNKELYRVAARYLTLRLYRDGIADGVKGDGKGDDDKRNDHRADPYKSWRHLPNDVRTFSLRSSMLSVSFLLLSISQSLVTVGCIYSDYSSVK